MTRFSDQAEARRSACRVRGVFAEAAYTRSVTDSTTQPCGTAGSAKRTSARKLSLGPLDWTFRIESVPLLFVGLFSSIQASAAAASVVGAHGPASVIVHVWLAGVESTFPATSRARTRKVCDPLLRPVYFCGDVHAVKVALSSEHSNVAASLAENVKLALLVLILAPGPLSIVVCGATLSI